MKSLTVGLIFAAALGTAQPASAEVVWWDEPPLPYGSPVTFVDTVIETVRPERVAAWKAIRTEALEGWGVPYTVDIAGGAAPFDANVSEERNGIPGVIRLGRDVSGFCQSYGGWYGTVSGGIAVMCLEPLWWKSHRLAENRTELAHEVGHAFGLGHSSSGVMGGGFHVSEEERLAVAGWYA